MYAPLAIIVHLLQLGNELTAAAAAFVASRIAHTVIYALGIPLLQTIAFVIGLGAQVVLAARIVGVV